MVYEVAPGIELRGELLYEYLKTDVMSSEIDVGSFGSLDIASIYTGSRILLLAGAGFDI